jgi:hypothetical protein
MPRNVLRVFPEFKDSPPMVLPKMPIDRKAGGASGEERIEARNRPREFTLSHGSRR